MYFRREHLKRTARAPAKLNLYLEVLGRRADGFHEIETLMVPIRWSDSVSISSLPAGADGQPGPFLLGICERWTVRPPPQWQPVPAGTDNIVIRALDLLRRGSNCRHGARVDLVKRVPAAAGLGGGSSDAATALRLANRVWQLRWPEGRLREIAADVGSDVPFFLARGPSICGGRGEKVQRLPPMKPLHFVVVQPPDRLGTVDVYRSYDKISGSAMPAPSGGLRNSDPVVFGRWGELGRWMHNGLEAAAAMLSPWVDRLRRALDRADCLAHQLSGSGSAYFGVCRDSQHARRLAAWLKTQQLGMVYVTRSYP